MQMIKEHQKRALTEILAAASDMLEIMDEAGDGVYDKEWREAVRDSIDTVGLLIRSYDIHISKKED